MGSTVAVALLPRAGAGPPAPGWVLPTERMSVVRGFGLPRLETGEDRALAVARVWGQVEGTIDAAASEAGISASTFPEKLRALADKGLLQPATVDAVTGLRVLRNLSVHSPEPIPQGKLRDFLEMAGGVMFAVTVDVKHGTKKKSK